MNRSVRNGLAIAGMAGGLFFLGQAVASAAPAPTQAADTNNVTSQSNTSTPTGGSGTNRNDSDATAKNVSVTKVDTSVAGGTGGSNTASVNTGVINGGGAPGAPTVTYLNSTYQPKANEKPFTTVTFDSGDVTLTQNANGGSVSNSGNTAIAGGAHQTAVATNTVNQSNTTTGEKHHSDAPKGTSGPDSLSPISMGNNHHGNSNTNDSDATAKNVDITKVDTTVTGGDGGRNYADINTGIIGNTFYCPQKTSCTFNFHTGDVTLVQNANGGSVNGSGNVGIGAPVPGVCPCPKPVVCPEKKVAVAPAAMVTAVKPAVQPAAQPAVKAVVLSSAQPKGQLASTGADVSLPLTVGLLALAAGIGLTAAGRRRETQTV